MVMDRVKNGKEKKNYMEAELKAEIEREKDVFSNLTGFVWTYSQLAHLNRTFHLSLVLVYIFGNGTKI